MKDTEKLLRWAQPSIKPSCFRWRRNDKQTLQLSHHILEINLQLRAQFGLWSWATWSCTETILWLLFIPWRVREAKSGINLDESEIRAAKAWKALRANSAFQILPVCGKGDANWNERDFHLYKFMPPSNQPALDLKTAFVNKPSRHHLRPLFLKVQASLINILADNYAL